jgi:hypothetical protein
MGTVVVWDNVPLSQLMILLAVKIICCWLLLVVLFPPSIVQLLLQVFCTTNLSVDCGLSITQQFTQFPVILSPRRAKLFYVTLSLSTQRSESKYKIEHGSYFIRARVILYISFLLLKSGFEIWNPAL